MKNKELSGDIGKFSPVQWHSLLQLIIIFIFIESTD